MKIIVFIIVMVLAMYLFMIAPRLTKQKKMEKFRGIFYAHRGFHDNTGDAPENSLLAFQRAVEKGYGIELDVQLTRDDVLVVFHDDTLERVCGQQGKIEDYTYAELEEFQLLHTSERIPKFENVLKVIDGKVPLIVEIKLRGMSTGICDILNPVLLQYKGDYCVESFNPLAVKWYKKHSPETIRGQLASALNYESGEKKVSYFCVEHLLSNVLTRPDFIAYNHKFKDEWSRRICRTLFRNFSVTWTIKSLEELEYAKNAFDIFIFEGFDPSE